MLTPPTSSPMMLTPTFPINPEDPMTTIDLVALKVEARFKAGFLPQVDPEDPVFRINLGSHAILATISPKAARRLIKHTGPATLQGRLVDNAGQLWLVDAGFTFIDPKPSPTPDPATPLANHVSRQFNRDLSQPPLGATY